MDSSKLADNRRASIASVGWMRWKGTVDAMRIRDWMNSVGVLAELEGLASIWTARPAVRVNHANFNRRFARTPSGYVNIPGQLHYDLSQNLIRFGRRWPQRTARDRDCARCAFLEYRSVALSFGDDLALCRACEIALGFNLEFWPSCDECGHPFPTATAGEPGQGRWADPIAPGESTCGPCWLEVEYHGDRALMIEHTIRCETIECATTAVSDAFDSDERGVEILDTASGHLWEGRGIFELLLTESVTLAEAATTIRHVAIQLGIESPARLEALKRREALWRDERRSAGVEMLRNRTKSARPSAGTHANRY